MSKFGKLVDVLYGSRDAVEGRLDVLNSDPSLVTLTDMSKFLTGKIQDYDELAKSQWSENESERSP